MNWTGFKLTELKRETITTKNGDRVDIENLTIRGERATFFGIWRPCENDANCIYYMADKGSGKKIWKNRENPSDGYRSYMDGFEEIPVSEVLEQKFNLNEQPIEITIDEDSDNFTGVVFYSLKGTEIGRIGTQNLDDYYPSARDELDIIAINREYFGIEE